MDHQSPIQQSAAGIQNELMQANLWDNSDSVVDRPERKAEFKPRPYQAEAADAVMEAFQGNQSALVVMATGTGKTVLFSEIVRRCGTGRRLVIAHREELIYQAVRKIRSMTDLEISVEMAETWSDESIRPDVVVSTIQTQTTGRERMRRFDPFDFSLVVIDEAHRGVAKSYKKLAEYYLQNPNLKILGVTATPDRADEAALGQVFDTVAYDYEILDAINDGWLVPIRQNAVEVHGLDYSGCRTTAGDLNGADLERILEEEEMLHKFADPTFQMARGRKTLMFASSVRHAEMLSDILNRHHDGSSQWICGKTPKDERRRILNAYSKDEFQFLVNVGIATEGFDEPGVELVVIGRPTKSRALYAQMVGRGTRPLPGIVDGPTTDVARRQAIESSRKPYVEVIDFVGNAGRHKLMSAADILGGRYDDEIVELAAARMREKTDGSPKDVQHELQAAHDEIHAAREKRRRERMCIVGKASWETLSIDPFDALGIEPERVKGWDRGRRLTKAQSDVLERNGIDPNPLSYSQAKQLIDHIMQHPDRMPCTKKQASLLKRYGYDVGSMNKATASSLIGQLANNGWRKPS